MEEGLKLTIRVIGPSTNFHLSEREALSREAIHARSLTCSGGRPEVDNI